jgi:hypothetical protein
LGSGCRINLAFEPNVPEPLELEVMSPVSVEVEVLGENSVWDKASDGIE